MSNTKHGHSGKSLLQLFIGHSGAGKAEQGEEGKIPPLHIFVVREREGVTYAPWGSAFGYGLFLYGFGARVFW